MHNFKHRYYFVIFLFMLGISILAWRLISLTVFENDFLQNQGNARSLRTSDIPAFRGMITDRNGQTLAVSLPVYAIWANPKKIDVQDDKLAALCEILKIDLNTLQEKISDNPQKGFLYLARGVIPYVANKVKNLKLSGIHLQGEFKRYYPHGEITSHIIGFNNIDDQGQEGVELLYDDLLRGISGKRKVHKDRYGHVVEDLGILYNQKPGKDLQLSIDLRLQHIAYNELIEAMQKYQLKSGSIVILDSDNGEVLAMVNAPSFNPNKRVDNLSGQQRNRAVTDLYELGSVMKPFLVAAALDSEKFQGDTLIDTRPGWMVIGGKTIKDLAYYGEVSVHELLKKSSNVGIIRMLEKLHPKRYTDLLKKAGVGDLTYLGFPGERTGVILEQKSFNHTLAVLSMGYSVSLTPLQLARAFSIFVGDGKLRTVSLLKKDSTELGIQVISEKTSQEMLQLLEITKRGTTRRGLVPGYRVAAKTGTARLLGEHGYDKNRHIGSVAGVGPISNPKLIVAIVLNDPAGKDYYGGVIAAPVFAKVMSQSLRTLQVPGDAGE